jgi:hypothetical protein
VPLPLPCTPIITYLRMPRLFHAAPESHHDSVVGPQAHPPTDHPADLSLRSPPARRRPVRRDSAAADTPRCPLVPRRRSRAGWARHRCPARRSRAVRVSLQRWDTSHAHSSRSRTRSVDTRSFRLTAARRRGSLFVTLSGASGRRSGCPFGPRPNGTSGTASARDVDQPRLRWRVAQRTRFGRPTHHWSWRTSGPRPRFVDLWEGTARSSDRSCRCVRRARTTAAADCGSEQISDSPRVVKPSRSAARAPSLPKP